MEKESYEHWKDLEVRLKNLLVTRSWIDVAKDFERASAAMKSNQHEARSHLSALATCETEAEIIKCSRYVWIGYLPIPLWRDLLPYMMLGSESGEHFEGRDLEAIGLSWMSKHDDRLVYLLETCGEDALAAVAEYISLRNERGDPSAFLSGAILARLIAGHQ